MRAWGSLTLKHVGRFGVRVGPAAAMNNSTRPLPDAELDAYLADRWPNLPSV